MSTADERVIFETKHGVRLYPPTGAKGYYRLRYYDENGQKREPSGGRDFARAEAKAREIDERLAARFADPSGRTMNDLIDLWLADTGHEWSASHIAGQTTLARRFMRPVLGELPAWPLTRAQVETCLKSPEAESKKVQLKAAMGSLLNWAYSAAEPMLPQPKTFYMPSVKRRTAKTSRSSASQHGTTAQYVEPVLIPGKTDARDVAEPFAMSLAAGGRTTSAK